MSHHPSRVLLRSIALTCLFTATGVWSSTRVVSAASANEAQGSAESAPIACHTVGFVHTLQPRDAHGAAVPGPATSVRATYSVCPRAARLEIQPARSTSPNCKYPAGAPSARSPTPFAIGREWDHVGLTCKVDKGVNSAADVFEGPSYGTFEWWYYQQIYGFYDYFDDNVYCGSPDGCTIYGNVTPIANSRYTQLILYWQAPAVIDYAYCDV